MPDVSTTSRLPASYCDAACCAVTPCCDQRGRIGVSFTLADGGVVRLALEPADLQSMAAAAACYLKRTGVQSPASSPTHA